MLYKATDCFLLLSSLVILSLAQRESIFAAPASDHMFTAFIKKKKKKKWRKLENAAGLAGVITLWPRIKWIRGWARTGSECRWACTAHANEDEEGGDPRAVPCCWNMSMVCGEVWTGSEWVRCTELRLWLGMLLLPPGLANHKFYRGGKTHTNSHYANAAQPGSSTAFAYLSATSLTNRDSASCDQTFISKHDAPNGLAFAD